MNWLAELFKRPWQPAQPTPLVEPPATPAPWAVVLKEALVPPQRSDDGFRRISGPDIRRDLADSDFDWHLRLCNWLWRQNPIAKRAIQNNRAFVASEGFRARATCANDRQRDNVQKLLEEHWSINEWEDELSRRVETLSVEGEWLYGVGQPNPDTGAIRLYKVLPENVDGITRCKLNAERLVEVQLRQDLTERLHCGTEQKLKRLAIAHLGPDGIPAGNMLYLGINRLSGQTRGWSDLLVAADYLDVLDKLLFNETDRTKLARWFAMFVKLKGKRTEDDLLASRDRILREGLPKAGGILVHDETEEWSTQTPQLNTKEAIDLLRFVMSICFGALGMPWHFFSEGGDVNKSTASEMNSPIWASIRDRKRMIQAFFRMEFRLALYWYRRCGRMFWVDPANETFEVVSRDPERSAYDLIGKMLGELGTSLMIGQEAGWLTKADAGRAFRTAATYLGIGDFQDAPDVGDLNDASDQVDRVVELRRPQLENTYPLAVDAAA
jgi:hypothetical protein